MRLGLLTRSCIASLLAAAAAALALAGCGDASSALQGSAGEPIRVVAAENFWGSIAAQLGGSQVAVRASSSTPTPTRTPTNPRPPTASRSRARRWRSSTASAMTRGPRSCSPRTPRAGGSCSTWARCSGSRRCDNPHQWYSPSSVRRVIAQIIADYQRLDPADAAYFKRRSAFETTRARRIRPPARADPRTLRAACRSATARASSSRSAEAWA